MSLSCGLGMPEAPSCASQVAFTSRDGIARIGSCGPADCTPHLFLALPIIPHTSSMAAKRVATSAQPSSFSFPSRPCCMPCYSIPRLSPILTIHQAFIQPLDPSPYQHPYRRPAPSHQPQADSTGSPPKPANPPNPAKANLVSLSAAAHAAQP